MAERLRVVLLVQLLSTPVRATEAGTTFVLYDSVTGKTIATNAELANTPMIPCSTFKIPNTLIGLATGVISNEKFSLKWDGVKRPISEWNRDQDLASALQYSVVWFYQEIARRVGAERMQRYLNLFDYGNKNICCGIDQFWLTGQLRITPLQQVEFLSRMLDARLPVDREQVALVRRLLTIEKTPEYTLQGKTGTCEQDGHGVAWLVGFVERNGHKWTYALLELGPSGASAPSRDERITRTKRLLLDSGVLPRR
jgi:beta-lactamase class D